MIWSQSSICQGQTDTISWPKAISHVIWNLKDQYVIENKAKEVHNITADIQELLYDYSRGNMFKANNVHEFIVNIDNLVG